jgi:hypothetical protein
MQRSALLAGLLAEDDRVELLGPLPLMYSVQPR